MHELTSTEPFHGVQKARVVLSLDQLILAWLAAKEGRTESQRTRAAYEETLGHFRGTLHQAGLDLDSDPEAIAYLAQGWAATPWRRGASVSAATHNLRLAIVSSFYRFAMKRAARQFQHNPILLVDRRSSEESIPDYLLPEDVQQKLAQIDRATPAGARDYALLLLALITGRRRAELAALCWGDVRQLSGERLLVHFRRCKGKKARDDIVEAPISTAICAWMERTYGNLDTLQAEAPLWVCLAPPYVGESLCARSLNRIWEKRLGISKVHVSRHTFARTMEDEGATNSEIAERLAQDNPAIVGRYLARMHRSHNKHQGKVAARFGLTRDTAKED